MLKSKLHKRDNPFDKNEILIASDEHPRFCGVSKSDTDGEGKADLIIEAVNSYAALKEQIGDLQHDLYEAQNIAWPETSAALKSENERLKRALTWIKDHPAESNAVVWDVAESADRKSVV